jgi:hypothetical protein
MKKQKTSSKPVILKPDLTEREERGATITKPASKKPPKQGVSSNSSNQK